MDIRLKYEKGILYLSIYNSFDGVVYKSSNSKFKTRKRDDVKHGYGLQSVERVVKKYSGIMRITHDEQMFCVDLYFMYRYIKCRQDVEFSIPWRYFGLFERITGYVKLSVLQETGYFYMLKK